MQTFQRRSQPQAFVQYLATIIVILLAGLAGTHTPAAAAALSQHDQQCMTCHGLPGLTKTLSNGETLPLHIDASHFADSVHAPLGCSGCHANVNLASHPPANNPIASRKAFSAAMSQQVCATCHTKEAAQWGQSVHAALVRQGDARAPVCTNCHAPHTMVKGEAASIATVPCKACHATIFAAYATSVHGILRNQGSTAAPLCFNCHGAHDIAVASAGVGRRDVCLSCHQEAFDSHRNWLPNVDLHFAVVSCPVCHTPKAHRVVDLILYNSQTQKEISQPQGVPEFESFTLPPTAQRPGLDPATLMTLLTALDGEDIKGKTAIRGRLEVATGIEDHEISFAAKAISDCATCHRKGSAAFQSVKVSVAGPAGIPISYNASSTVLTSALTLPAVGGFYAIGGTRIGLLDIAFALALVVGVGWSVVHCIARWVFRRLLLSMQEQQRKG